MGKQIDKFVVYNLRETYHELGKYDIKIVLNPKLFKNSHFSEATLVDSDSREMSMVVEKWGRKMNCSFVISENVADGVSLMKVILKNETGKEHVDYVRFWVIKP